MNNEEYDDFIGTYKDVFPAQFCSKAIEEFSRLKEQSFGWTRKDGEGVSKLRKDDYAINMTFHSSPVIFNIDGAEWGFQHVYREGLFRCIENYIQKYEVLQHTGRLVTSDMKMQETKSGQGYHLWHHEHDASCPERVLTFIVYLNTLDEQENGTTEFLYQQKIVRPVENTVVVWPAGFTHPHRGNPVYGNASKYIITGWIHYDSRER